MLRSKVDEKDVHEIGKKLKLNTFAEFYAERKRQYEEDEAADVPLPS